MPGCVIGKAGIAVDFWNIRRAPWLKLFFLTHMHSDHTEGLTSTWQYPIYCSELSAALLEAKLGLPKQLVRTLTTGDRHCIPLDDDRVGETITVTVLDAHHCPGSVMFQFEGHFGTVLVTGDFRFCSDMRRDLTEYVKSVDVLYLDNTYCDPLCEFPPRSNCADEIMSIIRRHPTHRILLGMHSLGKEELLVEIALAVQSKIVVSPERMTVISLLDIPDVFTISNHESRIQVIPLKAANSESVSRWTAECNTVIILCTALYTGLDGRPYCNHNNVFIVPYSDHSCYSELYTFVSLVSPRSIVPLVPYASPRSGPLGVPLQHRADMTCFNDLFEMSQVLPLAASGAAPERVVLGGLLSPSPVANPTCVCATGSSGEIVQETGPNRRTPSAVRHALPATSASRDRALRLLSTARRRLQHQHRRLLGVRFADDSLQPEMLITSAPDIPASLNVRPHPDIASAKGSVAPASKPKVHSCSHDDSDASSCSPVGELEHACECRNASKRTSRGRDEPSDFADSTDSQEYGDDFLNFYIPPKLRVRRELVLASVMHKLFILSNASENGVYRRKT